MKIRITSVKLIERYLVLESKWPDFPPRCSVITCKQKLFVWITPKTYENIEYLIASCKLWRRCRQVCRCFVMVRIKIQLWSRWRTGCCCQAFNEGKRCWKAVVIERRNLMTRVELQQKIRPRKNQFSKVVKFKSQIMKDINLIYWFTQFCLVHKQSQAFRMKAWVRCRVRWNETHNVYQ